MYVDRESSKLKHKLVITTSLRESILQNSVFRVFEILIDSVVLKMNLTSFGMYDFGIILGMDWLSTHQASMDFLARKLYFENQDIQCHNGFPLDLEDKKNEGVSIDPFCRGMIDHPKILFLN